MNVPSCGGTELNFKMYLFIYLKDRVTEKVVTHKERHPQTASTARAEAGQSQEPGASSKAPMEVAGTQAHLLLPTQAHEQRAGLEAGSWDLIRCSHGLQASQAAV